jgi:hypothetical protein
MNQTERSNAIDGVIAAAQAILSTRRAEALAERIDAIMPLLDGAETDGPLASFCDAVSDHRLDDMARLWPSVRRQLKRLSKASSIAHAASRRREG